MEIFDERQAQQFIARYPAVPPALALRVYTSRLIGKDPSLVLHGGGNTSVKIRMKNILGEEREVLFVKGSGTDLASIEPEGFAGLELEPLRKLRRLTALSDEEMENQLQIHKINFAAPTPSVEALLHAFLPARYIDHSHADFILALTNRQGSENLLRQMMGPKGAVIPYVRPGLLLAKGVANLYEQTQDLEAVIVGHHGIFAFGEDARTSYQRMIQYVTRAEALLKEKNRGTLPKSGAAAGAGKYSPAEIARFNQNVRGACAFREKGGRVRRFYTEVRQSDEVIQAASAEEARDFCASGVMTPDHVIRTKNQWVYVEKIPEDDGALHHLVKEAVENYTAAYDRYFSEQVKGKGNVKEKMDSYPRVFLVRRGGIVALGFTRREARVAADIAEHTLTMKLLANPLGKYEPISESHVFDMEYWPLQQKKLDHHEPPPLQGQVALVTGAGGAIGLGIADRLLAAGATVIISDIDEASLGKVKSVLLQKHSEDRIEEILLDVTNSPAVDNAFQQISYKLGGIDILVPNAGIAHVARIEELDPEKFDRVIAVNLKGTFNVIKAAVPIFKRQKTGGSIVVVSSKNVFDPGAAFGAYSASKAAAHQMAKIAALELADLGVRVNLVNPDAVFGDEEVPSKLWELVGPDRMKARGLDPKGLREYYRQRNLLKIQVTPEHVGNAVVFFATDASGATTGATLPIDGGIPAAFPR